jgi:hypothetical protein
VQTFSYARELHFRASKNLRKVETEDNYAAVLTKPLMSKSFDEWRTIYSVFETASLILKLLCFGQLEYNSLLLIDIVLSSQLELDSLLLLAARVLLAVIVNYQ